MDKTMQKWGWKPTRTGVEKFSDLLRTYFDLGGFHVQINSISADTLKEAQQKPESYRDLVIRVGGYSAYFVELDKKMQDNIIARTEHGALN